MSVSLVKNQKVNLSKEGAAAGHPLSKLMVGLGWDAKRGEISGAEFDLDAMAFIIDGSGKVLSDDHFVFFGSRLREKTGKVDKDGSAIFRYFSPEKAVIHQGDNLTGDGDGDDETIDVDLGKIPAQAERIVFAVGIYDAVIRKQNFGAVDNAVIRAVNAETSEELAKYELDMDASLETLLIFAELQRRGSDWIFSANSAGFPAGLEGLCRQYGVNI